MARPLSAIRTASGCKLELKTKQDVDSLEGDPDPVPYVRTLLVAGLGLRTTTPASLAGEVAPINRGHEHHRVDQALQWPVQDAHAASGCPARPRYLK